MRQSEVSVSKVDNNGIAMDLPFVSIVIPCLNERTFIGHCLDSILANDYPKDRLEVLVVDGMSTDGTREILQDYQQKYPSIRMIDNPDRYTPQALNRGIQSAGGDVIVRMDAHAIYQSDYISKSLLYLEKYDADNVGGIMRTQPRSSSLIGKGIAACMSSSFGMGNSYFRTGSTKIRKVDTVFGGCYPKRVFEQIGLFDERFRRGQDREFNVRLRNAGGKIILAPDIQCTYYARSNLLDHLRHALASGGVVFVLTKATGQIMFSWRNLVPLVFVLTLMVTLLLSLLQPIFLWIFLGIIALYFIVSVFVSLPVILDERNFIFLLIMPFVFFATHVAYGVGSLIGLLKSVRH